MAMVRKARCAMCGSAKATPTTSAYIYCDYCGQLMDFDVKRFLDQAPKLSAEHLEADRRTDKKIAGARGQKDRAKLMELYRQRHGRWLDAVGPAYSPRMNDPEYRTQLVEYLAFQNTFSDLGTPRLKEVAKKVSKANSGFEMHDH